MLLQKLPTEILELTPNGIIKYLGNYDYYVGHCTERRAGKAGAKGTDAAGNASSNSRQSAGTSGSGADNSSASSNAPIKESWEEKKARDRAEQKKARYIEKAEALIAEFEAEIAGIEAEIANPAHSSNARKLAELAADLDAKKTELDEAMEKWMELV